MRSEKLAFTALAYVRKICGSAPRGMIAVAATAFQATVDKVLRSNILEHYPHNK